MRQKKRSIYTLVIKNHLLYNNKLLKVKSEQRPNMQTLINTVEVS